MEYHEPLENWDVENNYDPNILYWANANYPKMFLYDDAHVNVLQEALPFLMDHQSRRIKREKKNLQCKSYNFMD